jgi:hypothetical protein
MGKHPMRAFFLEKIKSRHELSYKKTTNLNPKKTNTEVLNR